MCPTKNLNIRKATFFRDHWIFINGLLALTSIDLCVDVELNSSLKKEIIGITFHSVIGDFYKISIDSFLKWTRIEATNLKNNPDIICFFETHIDSSIQNGNKTLHLIVF